MAESQWPRVSVECNRLHSTASARTPGHASIGHMGLSDVNVGHKLLSPQQHRHLHGLPLRAARWRLDATPLQGTGDAREGLNAACLYVSDHGASRIICLGGVGRPSGPRLRDRLGGHGTAELRSPRLGCGKGYLIRSLMRRASPWRNRRITVGRHICQEPVHGLQPI